MTSTRSRCSAVDNGDLWVGDEFGPWILHFSGGGRLLDPPFALPGGLMSPNNPFLNGVRPATQPNSRGLEAMAITPDRRYLYAALEGATVADPDQSRRYVYQFDTVHEEFTGQVLQYRTEAEANLVADMWAVDNHRVVVIERDAGSGLAALFRSVYLVDLRRTDPQGFLRKTLVVDLTAIPDPDLVSLPPIHSGDVGLGRPVPGGLRVRGSHSRHIRAAATDRLRQQPAERRPQPRAGRRHRADRRRRTKAERARSLRGMSPRR